MVAARWNLVRIGCGPLVEKVADSCARVRVRAKISEREQIKVLKARVCFENFSPGR